MSKKISKTDAQWQAELSPEEFHVARQAGTEMAFSGKYDDFKEAGTFLCVCCGSPLFDSEHKFDSGSGWPSFWQATASDKVDEHKDVAHGMQRTEICCATCDAHLGHVFNDGPQPTGLRYCVNSASLTFKKP